MNKLLVLIFGLCSVTCFASDPYCEPVEAKGEGHWPIPEEKFTELNAMQAIEKLSMSIKDAESEYFEPFPRNENDLLMIRGFLLKSSIGKYNGWGLDEFCRFIKEEAFVRH